MNFQPDYRHFEDVMKNIRPKRMPIYEHIINPPFMESILNTKFADFINGNKADQKEFFKHYCRFFKEMTYDTVSFEVCTIEVFPNSGAIMGRIPGPIQSRKDFEKFPWEELPKKFEEYAYPRFDALVEALPEGMKVIGGVGNGAFEISEDLVGMTYLPFIQYEEPELYNDLFNKIGDLMYAFWKGFLERYSEYFVACRFGDDLGYKDSLLTNPKTVLNHIIPQYKRVINLIHSYNKPFLWHSCGNIFRIMEDVINCGINAKHSNEDIIAPFEEWIEKYNDKIALVGGFDMHFLCSKTEDEVYKSVLEKGTVYREMAKGYALGSGNSIPEYVPEENYLAMIRAANDIRKIAL